MKLEFKDIEDGSGICLSALYDRALDKGYISINHKFEVLISPILKKKQKENYYEKYFAHLTNSPLQVPKKYLPKKEFLEFHFDTIFKR
jgi:putative restriction endonuclease